MVYMSKNKLIMMIGLVAAEVLLIIVIALGIRAQFSNREGDIEDVFQTYTPTVTEFVIRYTLTSTLEPILNIFRSEGCTYSSDYLIYNFDDIESLDIELWLGHEKYTTSQAAEVFFSNSDAIFKELFLQLYTAKINVRLGADVTLVDIEIYRADTLLENYYAEGEMTLEEMNLAVNLSSALRDFNTGIIGPGLCAENVDLIRPSPTIFWKLLFTATFTPEDTGTPTSTSTPTPTATLTNTPLLGTPYFTPTPSKTEKPDEPVNPTQTQPEPTARNTRAPTSTSAPPPATNTPQPPPPTNTQEPPPTPTSAPTREPTPTHAGP
jgi:hypothetical protein